MDEQLLNQVELSQSRLLNRLLGIDNKKMKYDNEHLEMLELERDEEKMNDYFNLKNDPEL